MSMDDLNRMVSDELARDTSEWLEDGGWRNSFPGDYYREPDDVVRGVSMQSLDASIDFMGFGGMGNDPYHDSEDLARDASPEIFLDSVGGKYPGLLSDKKRDSSTYIPEKFTPSDEPPNAPTEEYWKYLRTTISVQSEKPGEGYKIGNHLLAFLNEKVVSEVLKVRAPSLGNARKFSIKADVSIDNVMCTMKIRVWKNTRGHNWYCVDFQRRRGDSVPFTQAYRQACAYLRAHMGPSGMEMDAVVPPQIVGDDTPCMISQDEITPLLDMILMIHMPSLQADSATALANLAQNRKSAALLCTAQAFEHFKNHLKSNQNQTSVAYPLACALSSLADCEEAKQFFATQGVLSIILEKVQSNETSATVQNQLMQTLSVAVTRCPPLLSEAEVGVLLAGLCSEAARSSPVRDGTDAEGEKSTHEVSYRKLIVETISTLQRQYRHAAD
jgi:hypothetical protein